MDNRVSFIESIRANPTDEVVRLAFADYLDDNSEEDKDKATAEYIRLTCRMKGPRITTAAGKWLDAPTDAAPAYENWQRLVPALTDQMNLPRSSRSPIWSFIRHGRWVRLTRMSVVQLHPGSPLYAGTCDCDLEFALGFVRRAIFGSWRFWDVVGPLLVCDQPLLEPELTGAVWEEEDFETVQDPYMHRRRMHPMGGVGFRAYLPRHRIGPAHDLLKPVLRGEAVPHNPNGYHLAAGPNNDAAERARLALARALLKRAEAIRDGKAQAGADAAAVAAEQGG